MSKELLRLIPKVDDILAHEDWRKLIAVYPEGVLKSALREYLDILRTAIKTGTAGAVPAIPVIIKETSKTAAAVMTPTLRRIINGTGVIVHTNLGRSLLAKEALKAMMDAGSHYSNLEYDLKKGHRGDRHTPCVSILKKLTGAEDALVVNNNAAAVFLVLNTFAEGKEVVISRGELVEIGGSFRVPDVMKKSGAILRETGTTNRTYLKDYEEAISEKTGLIMKVHPSNYRIRGFAHEATLEELVALGEAANVPTFYDAGSGLLYSPGAEGTLGEPLIAGEIAKGVDIVSFSGDKLLGGPQAGIIAGGKTFVDAMKRNPLTRALRPDKVTLAGLESTLLLYLDMDRAVAEIPTLRMIYAKEETLKQRATDIADHLRKQKINATLFVARVSSEVGGGSLPDVFIPSWGVLIEPAGMSVNILEERLRNAHVPLIGRIERERLLVDMRTIPEEDEPQLLATLTEVLVNG